MAEEGLTTADVLARFGEALGRFVRRRVRNAADADDVLQDALVRIHAGLPGVRDPRRLAGWIFAVARRAVFDHRRRRRSAPLERDVEAPAAPAGRPACLEPLAETLPEADRVALRMADVEGRSDAEFAARLGISLTAAKSRVQRARGRLQAALLDCCRVELDGRGAPVDFHPRRETCAACG
jgi:RNA polymerase sigma-70 factor (ECF subfamily)